MKLFWKKEKSVMDKIRIYTGFIDTCFEYFGVLFEALVNGEDGDHLLEKAKRVHHAESEADDTRKSIERELYHKALIPESRSDVMNILEDLDEVPGLMKRLSYQLVIEKIRFSTEIYELLKRHISLSRESWGVLKGTIEALFYSGEAIDDFEAIDRYETECDELERRMLTTLFEDDTLEKADKLQLKQVIQAFGDIPDTLEETSDEITIAMIKRRL